ncbi:type I-F CRISPR-associated protein Csy1 [Undibacterium sp. Di26W]|uniref:type I-F CRISPR-associated protein Csy1 n=1 Tax=Undibacterium sp. Di26W TaxID=3413035 RepID=UPI003BEFF3F0
MNKNSDKRAELVDELIDILFVHPYEIRNLTDHSGWSSESQISRAQQLWLDPFRDDKQFQMERESKDWQSEIAGQFSSWLNHKLDNDKLKMKGVEYLSWKKLSKRSLPY